MNSKNNVPILLHLAVWVFLFLFPVLTTDRLSFEGLLLRHWLPLFLSAFLFYLNYLVLVPKYYFSKQYLIFGLINAVLIGLSIYLIYEVAIECAPEPNPKYKHKRPSLGKIIWYRNGISFLLALGSAVALRMTNQFREEQKSRIEAEREKLRSEITSLKYQVQPHFFFNILNSIYSLIDVDTEKAKSMLHKLSKLMRYVLQTGDQQKVALRSELEFIESYVDLMRIRHDENVKVGLLMPENREGKIPPLLMISLIENAFKHGVKAGEVSQIDIAFRRDKQLELIVSNSYHPKDKTDESGSGIGLANIERRLPYIYPEGNFEFVYGVQEKHFLARLNIPIE